MTEMLRKMFNTIWVHEKTPKDWTRMTVTSIHMKGDKLNSGNYRSISLLYIPGKVFSRILLDRMKRKTEEATDESQFDFRPGRGTVDAIFIVRQVIEKAQKHRAPLHFVDFKGAFDTVWRKVLWKMMIAVGIHLKKIVRIIMRQSLHNETECAVVIDGQFTELFAVKIYLKQEYLLSPTISNIVLESVIKELKSLDITFKLHDSSLIDIRYADDTNLLSAIFLKLHLSTSQLEKACQKWGMKINGAKSQIISPSDKHRREEVVNVEEFVFLIGIP